MRIEVNFAKRGTAEKRKYTKHGFVRILSELERRNVLIQVRVCGVMNDVAEMVIESILEKLGLDETDLLSTTSVNNRATYDCAEQVYTDWICVRKDIVAAASGKDTSGEARSLVRRAAKEVKKKYSLKEYPCLLPVELVD